MSQHQRRHWPAMIITCPSCATRYKVPDQAFVNDDGRKVRCRGCAFEWIAIPDNFEPPESSADAEQLISDGQFEDIESAAVDLNPVASGEDFASQLAEVEKFERTVADLARSAHNHGFDSAAGNGAAAGRPTPRRDLTGWLALAACMTLIIGGAYEYREMVVTRLPATASLYEAVGLSVNIRGMEFANVAVAREFENGLPVLAVRGEIINVSQRMLDVPKIYLGLRDGTAAEIYHWTMVVASEPLAPAAHARFTTKLAAPPKEARDVVVRFHDAADQRAAQLR